MRDADQRGARQQRNSNTDRLNVIASSLKIFGGRFCGPCGWDRTLTPGWLNANTGCDLGGSPNGAATAAHAR